MPRAETHDLVVTRSRAEVKKLKRLVHVSSPVHPLIDKC